MFVESEVGSVTIAPQGEQPGEQEMVHQERWAEVRRLRLEEQISVSEIARRLDLDRKTVRRCLRQSEWRAYERLPRAETLLTEHAQFLAERAAQVNYSARILYQELRSRRGYRGSYETVKRFVAPLREAGRAEELCQMRFETGPGEQSQIDWGQLGTHFRAQPVTLHIFVLTLGFSRRGFYYACADEQMSQFLEAHERAFEHFGGLTREHLYDRPRTVCYPDAEGRRVWNPTFKSFAEYWGFEPRLCRAYRAQTKGKVESGVKYVKRNFHPGRSFVDIVDFQEQLDQWNADIADQRVHGTTHELPIERFAREREHLTALAGQPGFALARSVSRIVAEDWLVSFAANRYSVPFRLIGQTVSVQREGEWLRIRHRDELVAEHPLLAGKHQVRILPEHGPGAAARNQRSRRSAASPAPGEQAALLPQVEIRDLALYESLCAPAGREEVLS
ncbi:MAG: IS21 family transposase [Betaproteobacteria bacterium]|nr:MAG: IS21 family transposase [Betaproteobacteria bacterium]